MEAHALQHAHARGLRGASPLLRLQSDERLVLLARRGSEHAFEALVARYQSRLLAFCRHMLGSREDAEDVLQEVFAAAFNAMLADERPINVRPWLYRIARNRSLNHLRRTQPIGVDSMDVHLSEHGLTTADQAHRREEFRALVADVQELPETQRTALLLREIDALSYDQIAEAMETTIPSVKSLLVRARVSLAEMAEARTLTCEEVRDELGEVAEGLRRTSAPVRRHLRGCDRCTAFRKQLRATNRELASFLPVAPLLLLKKVALAHLGTTASASTAAAAGTAAGATGAGAISAGVTTVASKTAAGLAAAAIVTAGAVEVKRAQRAEPHPPAAVALSAPPASSQPVAVAQAAAPAVRAPRPVAVKSEPKPAPAPKAKEEPVTEPVAAAAPPAPPAAATTPVTSDPAAEQPAGPVQQEGDSTALPATDSERPSGGTEAPPETAPQPGQQQSQPPAQQQPSGDAQQPSQPQQQPPAESQPSPAQATATAVLDAAG